MSVEYRKGVIVGRLLAGKLVKRYVIEDLFPGLKHNPCLVLERSKFFDESWYVSCRDGDALVSWLRENKQAHVATVGEANAAVRILKGMAR